MNFLKKTWINLLTNFGFFDRYLICFKVEITFDDKTLNINIDDIFKFSLNRKDTKQIISSILNLIGKDKNIVENAKKLIITGNKTTDVIIYLLQNGLIK